MAGRPLVHPTSKENVSLWIRLYESKITNGLPVLRNESITIDRLAKIQSQKDIDNGFWNQALAIANWKLGNKSKAIGFWLLAANDLEWDSGQSEELDQPISQSDWTATNAVSLRLLRKPIAEKAADWLATQLLSYNPPNSSQAFIIRFANVKNGELIRRHARTLQGMRYGIDICDEALLPPGAPPPPGHHEMLIARIDLANEAKKLGQNSLATQIEEDFEENDSAVALSSRVNPTNHFERLAMNAAYVDSIPSSLLTGMLFSGLLFLFRKIYAVVNQLNSNKPWLGTISLASLILLVTLLCGFSLASVTLILSVLFTGLSPTRVRSRPPTYLGPLFELVCFAISSMFIIALIWFGANHLQPIQTISLEKNHYVSPSNQFFGAIQLIFATIFLIGPLWAFAQRTQTSVVVNRSLILCSRTVATICLFGILISTPICARLDRHLQKPLNHIAENEPNYYILQ